MILFRKNYLRLLLLLPAAIAFLSAAPAGAVTSCSAGTATITWDGGAGTSNWGDAANWNPDRLPTSTDHVCIGTPGVTVQFSVPDTTSVQSVQAAAGAALQVTSGTLTLTSTSLASLPASDTLHVRLEHTCWRREVGPGRSIIPNGRKTRAQPIQG